MLGIKEPWQFRSPMDEVSVRAPLHDTLNRMHTIVFMGVSSLLAH